MGQATVVESTGKHLDSLRATIGWAVLVAVVFAWAGLTDADPVTVLGLKIDIKHAVVGGWYSWGQASRARAASEGRKCQCESLSSTSQGAAADV